MQIEFHTGDGIIVKSEVVETLSDLIQDLRDLYQIGFRDNSYKTFSGVKG
jgi:hypothetical protein